MSTFTSLSLASSYWHMIIQHLHTLQVPTSLEVHNTGDESSSWSSKEHTTTMLTYVVCNTSIYSLLDIPGLCLFQKTVVSINKRPVLVVTELSSHTDCQNSKGIKDKGDINNSFVTHALKLICLTYALPLQLFSLYLNTLVPFMWVLSALCIGMYFLHTAITRGQNNIELQGRRQWMKRRHFAFANYTCKSIRNVWV